MPDRKKVIEGLRWILECDLFGFGDNWGNGEPRCDEERAGKYIWDAIELLTEKPKRESRAMLPCKCGCKRREHWYGSDGYEELRCMNCGFKVRGKNATDAIRNWNMAINDEIPKKEGET